MEHLNFLKKMYQVTFSVNKAKLNLQNSTRINVFVVASSKLSLVSTKTLSSLLIDSRVQLAPRIEANRVTTIKDFIAKLMKTTLR